MSNIGNILQIITIVASSLGIIISSISLPRRQESIFQTDFTKVWIPTYAVMKLRLRRCRIKSVSSRTIQQAVFYLSIASTIFTFFLLVYSFIISDFSVQNVFFNSSTLKPLIYKIAGSWSSHEGSILLWFCLLQIISGIFIFLINDKKDKNIAIFILSLIQLLFSSFIYFTSNPFDSVSFIPKEGLGLSPMLQDIALTIHPPILYLGYLSYVVPFVCACIILIRSYQSRYQGSNKLEMLLKAFANIGIVFMTCGIGLGSWWAYRELGWGGFWFFDPVENISLFPWLSAIVLHHCVLISVRTKKLKNWTIILSIITFLLVIFNTFLVRSGFITSVHSFAASPERAAYLLTIFLIIACGSVGLYIVSFKRLFNDAMVVKSLPIDIIKLTPKATGIILGNICFLISLVILISATIYPVIHSLYSSDPIIISEKFFVNNFIIFVIPILFIISFFAIKNSFKQHVIILIISLVLSYIIFLKVKYNFISAGVIIAAIALMLHNIYYLLNKTRFFQKNLRASHISMVLGHFGFALVAFSITMNVLMQREIDFIGKEGESKLFGNFNVTLQNVKFALGKNYYRQIVEFWIEDKNHNITVLKPENRLYIIEKSLSQESDIYSYLTYDLYAVLSNIDDDIIHAKIYYRPMISFFWFGIIITVGGFLIGLINKK